MEIEENYDNLTHFQKIEMVKGLFTHLNVEQIEKILNKFKYDLDEAFDELSNLNEEKEETTESIGEQKETKKPEKKLLEIETKDGQISAKINLESESNHSWIGFYSADKSDKEYIQFQYLCKLPEKNIFQVPDPHLKGTYEFRCFLYSYNLYSKSETISLHKGIKKSKIFFFLYNFFYLQKKIDCIDKLDLEVVNDNTVQVRWKIFSYDVVQKKAYLTIHFKSESRPRHYRRWDWINSQNGSQTFKKPIHTGFFFFFLFFNLFFLFFINFFFSYFLIFFLF